MTRVALWPVEGPRRAGAGSALMALPIVLPAVMHKRRDRECLEFLQISPTARAAECLTRNLFLGFSLPRLFVRQIFHFVFFPWKKMILPSLRTFTRSVDL